MIKIAMAKPDDWKTVRNLRMDALAKASDVLRAGNEPEEGDDAGWQEYLRQRLEGGNITFIAYNGETPVGMACGKPNPYKDDAYILYSLWVAPIARGLGVAKLLNAEHASHAKLQGYKYAQACCNVKNDKSIGLYRGLGYTEMPKPSEFRPVQTENEIVFYLEIKD